jgi:hypothetical protein
VSVSYVSSPGARRLGRGEAGKLRIPALRTKELDVTSPYPDTVTLLTATLLPSGKVEFGRLHRYHM